MSLDRQRVPSSFARSANAAPCVKFLLIDDNSSNRFLVSKSLARRFPDTVLVECDESDAGLEALRREPFAVVVAHRTHQLAGTELVRQLRQLAPAVPIIAISAVDRRAEALQAGATRFLLLDEWLLIGNVVQELLGSNPELIPAL